MRRRSSQQSQNEGSLTSSTNNYRVQSEQSLQALAQISSSPYFSQVLRVSWNIIEGEILTTERFQLGKDVEKFYELNQQLSMDDLARRRSTHTRVCLVRVVGRVVRNLERPKEVFGYLRTAGRLHQLAGVDRSFLALSG